MLAFGWNFHFGHLDYTFHDGRVVYTVFVRGVRFRFVGGLGAPPSRLATVESGDGGGGNEPTEEEGVLVKVVSMTKGRVSARHSNEGLGWPGGYPGSCSVMSFIRVGVF